MDWSDEPETTSALTPFAPLPGQTAPLPQRLTVQYLFVWMTTTSILLALYMAGPGRPSEQQFTDEHFHNSMSCRGVVLLSAQHKCCAGPIP